MSVSTIAAGSRVSLQVSGTFGSVTRNAATFREDWLNQLRMQGYDVQALDVQTGGLLERVIGAELFSTTYRATVTVTPLASANVSDVIAAVMTAAENAGSYTPAVSVPSVGQVSQPAIDLHTGALGDLADGLGDVPTRLFSSVNLIVIGLVVVAALVAFGPNVKSVARAVR